MADDRQSQPRAPGVAAAGSVDSVEALEDSRPLVRGDADALVRDGNKQASLVAGHGHIHLAAGIAELHGVVKKVEQRRLELDARTPHSRLRVAGRDHHVDAPLRRRLPDSVQRAVDDVCDLDHLVHPDAVVLEAGQCQQVVDRVGDALDLDLDAVRETGRNLGIRIRGQRFCQQAQCPYGCLEFMAHVRHEIAAHRLRAVLLGGVAHESHRSEQLAIALDRAGLDLVAAARLGPQFNVGGGLLASAGPLKQVLERAGHESLTVASLHDHLGGGVAGHQASIAVAHHEAGAKRVEASLDLPCDRLGRGPRGLGSGRSSLSRLHRLAHSDPTAPGRLADRTVPRVRDAV